MDIADLLLRTMESGASDLHLTTGQYPCLRINGKIKPLTDLKILTSDAVHDAIYSILTDVQKKQFERELELDFALEIGTKVRFRGNCFCNRLGNAAVFRAIPTEILTLEDLNMPAVLKDLCAMPHGIVLVTGPTGSGKSTTIAAMVNYINETKHGHILTLEDPIEFVHQHKKCIVNQREVGSSTMSFANALRAALREDPDTILVGEMRDLETIQLALTAAETGHLVFATLHTSSAPKTIDRIIDVFPPEQQEQIRIMLSESIQGVICQCLIPRADNTGRVCAMEIMLGVSAIRALIREGKTHQIPSMIQVGARYGMQSLDQQLKNFVYRGLITKEDAIENANNKYMFEQGDNTPITPVHNTTAAVPGISTRIAKPVSHRPVKSPQESAAQAANAHPEEDWMKIYKK